MGRLLFPKTKTPDIQPQQPLKIPAPPAPLPPPATADITGAGEAERRKLRRKRGRKETFLTGELVPVADKKQFLG